MQRFLLFPCAAISTLLVVPSTTRACPPGAAASHAASAVAVVVPDESNPLPTAGAHQDFDTQHARDNANTPVLEVSVRAGASNGAQLARFHPSSSRGVLAFGAGLAM